MKATTDLDSPTVSFTAADDERYASTDDAIDNGALVTGFELSYHCPWCDAQNEVKRTFPLTVTDDTHACTRCDREHELVSGDICRGNTRDTASKVERAISSLDAKRKARIHGQRTSIDEDRAVRKAQRLKHLKETLATPALLIAGAVGTLPIHLAAFTSFAPEPTIFVGFLIGWFSLCLSVPIALESLLERLINRTGAFNAAIAHPELYRYGRNNDAGIERGEQLTAEQTAGDLYAEVEQYNGR